MNPLNTINFFLKRLRASAHQDPVRDWLILVVISFAAFVGIIAWNVSAFSTLTNSVVANTLTPGAPSAFSDTSLETIHTIFISRAIEQDKYIAGIYRYIDPSQ